MLKAENISYNSIYSYNSYILIIYYSQETDDSHTLDIF